MIVPFHVARVSGAVRKAVYGIIAFAALCGVSAVQAEDTVHVIASNGISKTGPQDLMVAVPEGPANGAISASAPQSAALAAFAPQAPAGAPASLADLVEATPLPASLSPELECLAGAVYFESKSESLAGQLAVARVIVARSHSGRYPSSYCGVVYQPSQFSFVRGHTMPAISHTSRYWANAARIAQIADQGSWKSPVEGALFFHAARVSPRWGKTRLAAIGGHVFYR